MLRAPRIGTFFLFVNTAYSIIINLNTILVKLLSQMQFVNWRLDRLNIKYLAYFCSGK